MKQRNVTTSQKKIKSSSEEDEGIALFSFFRGPTDSPMENNKYTEEEEEDECIYTHICKGDVCPSMGKDLVECRDGDCPHNHLLHARCQHLWEKSRTNKYPGISFPPIKSRTWL